MLVVDLNEYKDQRINDDNDIAKDSQAIENISVFALREKGSDFNINDPIFH